MEVALRAKSSGDSSRSVSEIIFPFCHFFPFCSEKWERHHVVLEEVSVTREIMDKQPVLEEGEHDVPAGHFFTPKLYLQR